MSNSFFAFVAADTQRSSVPPSTGAELPLPQTASPFPKTAVFMPLAEQKGGCEIMARFLFDAGYRKQLNLFVRTISDMSRWIKQHNAQILIALMEKAPLYAEPAACLARLPSVRWILNIPRPLQAQKFGIDRLVVRVAEMLHTVVQSGKKGSI